MKVLMVDDHVMVLQGLKQLLGVLHDGIEIDCADTIDGAVEAASRIRHDLVLLDWNLEACRGAESIRRLRDVGCTARIVVLSGEAGVERVHEAIELGAAGFVPKRYSFEAMVLALQFVLAGGIFLPPEVQPGAALPQPGAPLIEPDQRLHELTRRQVDVYRAAARGLPNKLIARELGIAETTVKTHLSAVYALLGVRNRTEAAYQASREGIRVG